MRQYQALLQGVLTNGEVRKDRTGVGTIAVFGATISFDLREGFPAVTTKQLMFNSVKAELAGFLEGTTSLARMQELGTHIWDANAAANNGHLGRIYGAVWRNLNGVDQLAQVVKSIVENPTSRRHRVTAWEVPSDACLPACHTDFQLYVSNKEELDCIVDMRSVDLFLGLPFDIASYALLMHIICKQVRYEPRYLTFHLKDTHIYLNHLDQVKELLSRHPKDLPYLQLSHHVTIDNFAPEMAGLLGYQYWPAIKADMAV